MLGVVVQIDGYDPVTAAAITLRAASRDMVELCHLDGKTWWPTIAKLPTLRYDLFDGAFGGQISAPSSSLTLATEAWPDFARYALADARLRLWTGDVGAAWADYTLRLDGRISDQPQSKDGQAQVSFAVDDRWLDAAMLPTYAGTTGAEGPAALKGQIKPLALGAPRYVGGVLIDTVNSVFQISNGPVHAITTALDRLVRYGAPVADHPTYEALVAATVTRGTWATANAVGMARFGAPPEGQVSFLVEGDTAGADGWSRKPGQIIRRIAALSGGALKIDDASLVRLDAARPYNLSLNFDQQTTARDAIQKIAASVNSVAGVSWTGALFVVPVALGISTVTLAADGSALPPVSSVEQIAAAAPWAKLAIGAERAWSVHALSDIAFTAQLIDLGAYVAGTTYREGNIVQSRNISWLYTNPVATAGNEPPAAPLIENDFWKAISPPVNAAGVPLVDLIEQTARDMAAIEDAVGLLQTSLIEVTGLADDGVLTIDEKIRTLIPEDKRLEAAWAVLDAQASVSPNSNVASVRASAASARSAWISYRGTIDPVWNDTKHPSDVARSTFVNTITNYSTALTRLADALRVAAGLTAMWDNVYGAGKDQLISATNNAATWSASALSQLTSLVSDNMLDRSDKPRVKQLYDAIGDEQPTLVTQAQARGVDPSPLQQRQNALANYLGGLSPAWDDFNQDTPLPQPGGGETLRSYFREYYTARTNLLAAIDGKARAREDLAVQTAERAASDGWLDGGDKREATVQRQALLDQMAALVGKHDALGRPDDVTPYRTAAGNALYTNLIGYLNNLIPPLNDFANATAVSSSAYINAWSNAVSAVNAFDAALLGTVSNDVHAAVASVADITFDGVWSPVEKRTVLIPQDQRLEATYGLLSNKASLLTGTSNVVAGALNLASNARANWYSFRSGRSPAWNDTSGPTSVNRAAALEVFAVYGQHLDGLAEALRAYTDTRATTALDRTTAMDSDGVLSMGEKYRYVEDWQVLNAGYNALNQQYQINGYPQSVASSASNASAKLGSHAQLLGSLNPAWDNGNFDTNVNGPALRESWIAVRSAMEIYSAALAGRSQASTPTPTPTPTPTSTLPTIYFNNTAIPHGWISQNTDITMTQGQSVSLTFSIEVQNQVPDDSIVQMFILVGVPGQGYSGQISDSYNWIIGPSALGSGAFTATFTNYGGNRTLSFAAHIQLTDAPQLVTTGNNNSYLRRNS